MASVSESTCKCFLCESDVSSGTMLTKRRKLTGSVTKVAIDVLDELSLAKYKRKHVQVKQCLLETIDYGTVTEWLNNNIIPCIH